MLSELNKMTNLKYCDKFRKNLVENPKKRIGPSRKPQEPARKKLRVLSCLSNENGENLRAQRKTLAGQFKACQEIVKKLDKNAKYKDTREFWLKYEKEWPELGAYAKSLFTVPASTGARNYNYNRNCFPNF